MPAFGPIFPDGDGANPVSLEYSSGTVAYSLINSDPDTAPSDTSWITSLYNTATAEVWVSLGAFPADLATADSIEIRLYFSTVGTYANDVVTVETGITTADDGAVFLAGASSSAPEVAVTWNAGNNPPTTGVYSVNPTYVNTTADKATWDASWLHVGWTKAKSGGWDSNQIRLCAVEINGVYTAAGADKSGTAAISAATGITASGKKTTTGTGTISATTGITASGTKAESGTGSISATTGITASGQKNAKSGGTAPTPTYDGYYTTPDSLTTLIQAPDATALDITGDLDIRCLVRPADANATYGLVAKGDNTLNRSYYFKTLAGTTRARLRFGYSPDGTQTNQVFGSATAELPAAWNTSDFLWVRVTVDVNNGTGNMEWKFWYSADAASTDPDSVSWTQLGTSTLHTINTIFSSNQPVTLGNSAWDGPNPFVGDYAYGGIWDGIDGTLAGEADLRNSKPPQTDSVGNLWEKNGTGGYYMPPTSGNVIDGASLLLRASEYSGSGNWLDESENGLDGVITGATFSTDHFTFNGSTDIITVAHNADLDFGLTDDFTIIAVGAETTIPPSNIEWMAGKKNDYGTGNAGYSLYTNASGYPRFWIVDGTNNAGDTSAILTSGVKASVAGVRDTTADDLNAFTDGASLGTPITDPTTGTGPSNAIAFTIGKAPGSALAWTGDIYAIALFRRALSDAEVAAASSELKDGISYGGGASITAATGITATGSALEAKSGTASISATTGISGSGQKKATTGTGAISSTTGITASGSKQASGAATAISAASTITASGQKNAKGETSFGYLAHAGVTGDYVVNADEWADITGDLEIVTRLRSPWVTDTVSSRHIAAKRESASHFSTQWHLWIPSGTNRRPQFVVVDSEANVMQGACDANLPVSADGEWIWVKANVDVQDGSNNYVFKFYTSADDTNDPTLVNWTQLGNTKTLPRVGTVNDIRSGVEETSIGAVNLGAAAGAPFDMTYLAIISGIGGTAVAELDFTELSMDNGDGTFTDLDGNTWTIIDDTWTKVGLYAATGITATGSVTEAHTGTASITAATGISATGDKATSGAAPALSAITGITAAGSKAGEGVATLSAASGVTAAGQKDANGAGSATASLATLATGQKDTGGVGSISAITGITASGSAVEAHTGTASISAVTGITGTGDKAGAGVGTISAVSAATGAGSKAAQGQASTSVAEGTTGAGETARSGSGSISATTGITATGVQAAGVTGTASITAATGITGSGTAAKAGTTATSAASDATASGQKAASGTGAISAATDITASGTAGAELHFGTASITASTGINASGQKGGASTASLSATTGNTANGQKGGEDAASITAATSTSGSATKGAQGQGAIIVGTTATALGIPAKYGAAVIGLVTGITGIGTTEEVENYNGQAVITVISTITAKGLGPGVKGEDAIEFAYRRMSEGMDTGTTAAQARARLMYLVAKKAARRRRRRGPRAGTGG